MLLLAIIIFLLFGYLSYKRPVLSLSALAALLPAYNLRFEISLPFVALAKNGGLPSTILEFAIWGAFFGRALSLLWKRRAREDLLQFRQHLQKIKYPLALFFLASVISIFTAPNLYKAFGLWRAFFLEPALVLAMILTAVKDKKDFSKIIFGLSISALAVSLVAIGQRFFGLPILPPWDKELRATSVFIQPNMVGLYLGSIIILAIGQLISNFQFPISKQIPNSKFQIPKIIYWALVAILSFAAIIFAKSDGAIIGVLAGLTIFFLLWNKKTRFIFIVSALLLTTYYLLLPNNNFSFIKEKLLFGDWSGFVRLTIWRETWAMLKDNWLFGAGVGGYPVKILPYHASRGWMEVYPMPHNIIFNFWSELGLLGLAAFLWLLEKFTKLCYHMFAREKLFAITAISAMTTIIIHGLVDVPILKNDLAILFWIIYIMPFII